ncbi:hypothetical protein MP228_007475 [Amoeboaphelidium protococcarum]|nr:hypothetical protein MP228_007475 [Amoeboaphelidium protococcarum]
MPVEIGDVLLDIKCSESEDIYVNLNNENYPLLKVSQAQTNAGVQQNQQVYKIDLIDMKGKDVKTWVLADNGRVICIKSATVKNKTVFYALMKDGQKDDGCAYRVKFWYLTDDIQKALTKDYCAGVADMFPIVLNGDQIRVLVVLVSGRVILTDEALSVVSEVDCGIDGQVTKCFQEQQKLCVVDSGASLCFAKVSLNSLHCGEDRKSLPSNTDLVCFQDSLLLVQDLNTRKLEVISFAALSVNTQFIDIAQQSVECVCPIGEQHLALSLKRDDNSEKKDILFYDVEYGLAVSQKSFSLGGAIKDLKVICAPDQKYLGLRTTSQVAIMPFDVQQNHIADLLSLPPNTQKQSMDNESKSVTINDLRQRYLQQKDLPSPDELQAIVVAMVQHQLYCTKLMRDMICGGVSLTEETMQLILDQQDLETLLFACQNSTNLTEQCLILALGWFLDQVTLRDLEKINALVDLQTRIATEVGLQLQLLELSLQYFMSMPVTVPFLVKALSALGVDHVKILLHTASVQMRRLDTEHVLCSQLREFHLLTFDQCLQWTQCLIDAHLSSIISDDYLSSWLKEFLWYLKNRVSVTREASQISGLLTSTYRIQQKLEWQSSQQKKNRKSSKQAKSTLQHLTAPYGVEIIDWSHH